MGDVTVISLGGSIVVPDGIDGAFVRQFVSLFTEHLRARPEERLVLVVGGGSTARTYQKSARSLDQAISDQALDEIGIAATRLNAQIIRAAFGDLCTAPVFEDPTAIASLAGRVLVGGGWKPGFSTDNVAVNAAAALGAERLINLSNIRQIYTADPKIDPSATPLSEVSWEELFGLVGDEWKPGANTPFDPVATRKAAELSMTVIAADGRDLPNLRALLSGEAFVGTTIRP